MAKRKKAASKAAPEAFVSNVVPDRLDLRDRIYMPPMGLVPPPECEAGRDIPVLHQGSTRACTGFALATVIFHLLGKAGRPPEDCRVSPFMLYSMARRYDEFPGDPQVDSGSSARGAMKGWYKHGACADRLWDSERMPTAAGTAQDDWWLDSVRRPLGAYYRLDVRSVSDMHVALSEVGVLYATAICHQGWYAGVGAQAGDGGIWAIPGQKATPADGGHAFAIVGYNQHGFIIQNSWGAGWGSGGRAVLSYEDWLDHAMDCWVAQLGVVTELHEDIARATSLRTRDGKVVIAADPRLRKREISPFIIDMENNGRLSNTGDFRTQASDIEALVTQHIEIARDGWGLGRTAAIDIAVYAHGGLTSERDAAATAARWIPALYDAKIFPIFLMWETDLLSTLKNRLEDALQGQPRAAGGFFDAAENWWNERLEALLARPGTAIWGEMKQNGQAISSSRKSGGIMLYDACMKSPFFADPAKVRLHLIGHSAGSIVHSYIVSALCERGWNFETVNFMAPAVRMDVFLKCVMPHLENGQVRQLNEFHLADDIERKDPTCKPILGYSRSLLYLVSRSFEGGVTTPILGMQKYFDQLSGPGAKRIKSWAAPCAQSQCTTHGGFDDDEATMRSIIGLIKGRKI